MEKGKEITEEGEGGGGERERERERERVSEREDRTYLFVPFIILGFALCSAIHERRWLMIHNDRKKTNGKKRR